LVVSIDRAKVSTTIAIRSASLGVRVPRASAEVTAFAAAETSLALAGNASLTARSRQTGRMRSMQPKRDRVAAKRQLDGLAGQYLGLALKQHRGGERRPVARTTSTAGRVTRPTLFEGLSPHPLRRVKRLIIHRHLPEPPGVALRTPEAVDHVVRFW
jgi:hypothetical protein